MNSLTGINSMTSAELRPARARPGHDEGTVRIGGALAIPSVLVSLGADPAAVLAEAGVDLALFDDPDNVISYAARGRLLSHCAARTGCPHFGLLVGHHMQLNDMGLIGLLVRYSPDVGTALQWLEASDLDVARIAAALDHADASAFTRAFRRWSGTTPARWRAQARTDDSECRAGHS